MRSRKKKQIFTTFWCQPFHSAKVYWTFETKLFIMVIMDWFRFIPVKLEGVRWKTDGDRQSSFCREYKTLQLLASKLLWIRTADRALVTMEQQ